MHKIVLLVLAALFIQAVNAQHTFKPIIKNSKSQKSDTIPPTTNKEADGEELEEVVVQSTRTSRTIRNIPARIEIITSEEVDEKNNMRPANVSMLLHESTGLQVQQTSATSANASIRMQGLDGRYTQLLKDGYSNFGNFASGLSILEIPPLDLKQVEVIKGPASTLYGGGAIAGVVNFISKQPKEELEGDFILNQSHIGQTNVGGYISKKKNKFGYAVLGLYNYQKVYDVDKDDFSELPQSNNFTVNPRLFYYPNASTTLMLGNSLTMGLNEGGDINVVKGKADADHTYFEKNKTTRNITTLELDKRFISTHSLKIKQSLSIFDRHIDIPSYSFAGVNTNSFTDASFIAHKQKHIFISGINFVWEKFKQENTDSLNTHTATGGVYFQDTWDISKKAVIESGLRFDQAYYKNRNYSKNQFFVLPRISLLFKWTPVLSSRIGGGLGYKTPTMFTEKTESMQYQYIAPLNKVTSEKSIGSTADINYKTYLADRFSFSINQLFFYTRITQPLILQSDAPNNYYFVNAGEPITTKGFETNVKFIFRESLKLFAGYTYTHAKAGYLSTNQFLPLLPKSKLNLTLVYEQENNFKIGLESYFTDRQYLYDGSRTPSFWELGLSGQKTFNKTTFFINFENFTDQRQSKYKNVVNLPHNKPSFDDIWNHTEGFVVNGGIKWKL